MVQKAKPAPAKSAPAEQTAPDPVVEALQRELKQQGYYAGPIDGRMGRDTQDAVKRRDDTSTSRNAVKVSENNRAAKEAENDPVSQLTKTATEAAPYAAGFAGGVVAGHKGFGKAFEKQDAAQGRAASRIAKSAEIDPLTKESQLNQMNRNRLLRNTSQFAAPAMFMGAGYGTREFIAPQFSDPQVRDIVSAIGSGENAAGLALAGHQMYDTLRRGNPIADEDQAQIRSEATRARQAAAPAVSAPPTPAPAPQPEPSPARSPTRHSLRLGNAVTAAGGTASTSKQANYTALTKRLTAENMPAVAEALNLPKGADKRSVLQRARELVNTRGVSSYFLPLAVGAVAADAAYNEAQAASPNATGNAALAAGTAGGTAAAATYAGNRLLRRLPTAGQAMGPVAVMAADTGLEGPTREATVQNIAEARGQASHYAPWLAENLMGIPRSEGVTYDMAQVPERGDRSPEAMQAQARAQVDARTPDNDFDMALEDLRALLAASQSGGDDDEGAPPVIGPQPMQVSPMAYFPVMAPDNRLLRRF